MQLFAHKFIILEMLFGHSLGN